jgi:hypothetical protein
MDHETDEYWGTLLLEMAHDAREDRDFATAELLTAAAMKFHGEADRLAARWGISRRVLTTTPRTRSIASIGALF